MPKPASLPPEAVTVSTYRDLDRFVRAFASGHLNLLLLVGGPGLAKSQSVRKAVGDDDACWIEGNATAFGLYTKLLLHRDQLVVIDDVDGLYSDRAAVRLLKCLCQTDPVKRLAWNTNAAAGDVPREFETTSRVVIIANDWRSLNDNVAAVIDRGHFISFEPSADEIHRQVGEWFDDAEVYGWFEHQLPLIATPSMRHYVRATELKAAGLDWQSMMLNQWLPTKAALVARLKMDPSFESESERIEEFKRRGGGSRATYFNHAKKLRFEPVSRAA